MSDDYARKRLDEIQEGHVRRLERMGVNPLRTAILATKLEGDLNSAVERGLPPKELTAALGIIVGKIKRDYPELAPIIDGAIELARTALTEEQLAEELRTLN